MLIHVKKEADIPEDLRNTPIGELLAYHNFGKPFEEYPHAKLLIGMCMDNRHQLCIPPNFAYILRTGGANLRYNEFKISYAVAIGGVQHLVLIAHNDCGMVNLVSKRQQFVQGLCQNAGWDLKRAQEHFMNYAPFFEIDNEMDFTVAEIKRIGKRYPKVFCVPLFYNVDDDRLSIIDYKSQEQ